MIKYKRKVSIIAGESPSPIRLSQYDSDVIIELEIYATEGVLEIEPDTAVSLKGTKPDGNGISIEGELTVKTDKRTAISTYTASFNVIPQMTAVAGVSKYKLSLTKDDKELNTGSFTIVIDRAAMDKDTLPSESVIKEIVDTMDRTDELLAAAKSIKTAKKDIEKIRSIMDDIDSLKATIGEITRGVEVLRETVDDDIEQTKNDALKQIEDKLTTLDKMASDIAKAGENALTEINNAREMEARDYSAILDAAHEASEIVKGFKNTIIDITDKQNNIIDRLDALEGGGKS